MESCQQKKSCSTAAANKIISPNSSKAFGIVLDNGRDIVGSVTSTGATLEIDIEEDSGFILGAGYKINQHYQGAASSSPIIFNEGRPF